MKDSIEQLIRSLPKGDSRLIFGDEWVDRTPKELEHGWADGLVTYETDMEVTIFRHPWVCGVMIVSPHGTFDFATTNKMIHENGKVEGKWKCINDVHRITDMFTVGEEYRLVFDEKHVTCVDV